MHRGLKCIEVVYTLNNSSIQQLIFKYKDGKTDTLGLPRIVYKTYKSDGLEIGDNQQFIGV